MTRLRPHSDLPATPRGPRACRVRRAAAFTVIELMVVLAIIGLVLAVGVPAFNTMTREARWSQAVAAIRGAVTRAHYTALADRNAIALRFVRGDWSLDNRDKDENIGVRQVLETYRWTEPITKGPTGNQLKFIPRFEKRQGSEDVTLPSNVWVAPFHPLSNDAFNDDFLDGAIVRNPEAAFIDRPWSNLRPKCDDFLVVFDAQGGPRRYQAFDPATVRVAEVRDLGSSTPVFVDVERGYFTGLVLYPRDALVGLGSTAKAADRQASLKREGRWYYIGLGGALLEAGAVQ